MITARTFVGNHQRVSLFLIYFTVWIIANWPALQQAWWTADDYSMMMEYDFQHNLYLGRPVEGLYQSTLPLEQSRFGAIINIVLRYVQGMLHAAAATLAAMLLYRYTKRPHVLITSLLFVVWPFNGEAVLWRASALPLAACLAMVGLSFLLAARTSPSWIRYIGGICLIMAAALAHQLAAMIACLIWCYLVLFRLTPQTAANGRLTWRHFLLESSGIGVAYLSAIGGALGFIRYSTHSLFRATPPPDWSTKISYVQELLQKFLWNEYFPPAAHALQIGILTFVFIALLYALLMHRAYGVLFLVGLALLFILPYAPMLVVEENPTSPRIQYLAPFLWIIAILLADLTFRNRRSMQWGLAALTVVLLMVYVPIAQRNGADFVTSYNADRQALHQIETEVQPLKQDTVPVVTVATRPHYVRNWDLHNARYPWGDAKLSAYIVEWAVEPFIHRFSSLQTTQDPEINAQCVEICRSTAEGHPFFVTSIPNSEICCICP